MKTTVVTTTIYIPTFLKAYAENAERYNQEVDFIVIGDRKTPEAAKAYCEKEIPNCTYLDLYDQTFALRYFPKLRDHLPENSIARRNIGHLIAYEQGAECIIMLDDDNLSMPDQDFVQAHTLVGKHVSIHTFQSYDHWFNVCDALMEHNDVQFYARGYPPAQRWKETNGYNLQCRAEKIAVNAGLWKNDPDIDAITRLERRLITDGMKPHWPNPFALRAGTWSPWNCQNTAISRAALPSYFLSPFVGRHLDIWASYITTRIVEANQEVIAFGAPLAFHDRSPHNLYKDLEQELPWIQETDSFTTALRNTGVPVNCGYEKGLEYVIDGLDGLWTPNPPAKVLAKQQYLEGLRIWRNVFKELQ